MYFYETLTRFMLAIAVVGLQCNCLPVYIGPKIILAIASNAVAASVLTILTGCCNDTITVLTLTCSVGLLSNAIAVGRRRIFGRTAHFYFVFFVLSCAHQLAVCFGEEIKYGSFMPFIALGFVGMAIYSERAIRKHYKTINKIDHIKQ